MVVVVWIVHVKENWGRCKQIYIELSEMPMDLPCFELRQENENAKAGDEERGTTKAVQAVQAFQAFQKEFVEILSVLCELDRKRRYVVHCQVGRGSYGVVHKALDTHTGRTVAIKYVSGPKNLFKSLTHGQRVLKEVRINAAVSGMPGIVPMSDVLGVARDGSVLLVFPLGECDLADAIDAGRIGPNDFIIVVHHILTGLASLHARGVMHRDVKAKNVIFREGRWELCDLGMGGPCLDDGEDGDPEANVLTDRVMTLWQRAPELSLRVVNQKWLKAVENNLDYEHMRVLHQNLLGLKDKLEQAFHGKLPLKGPYTKAIDVWGAGCIAAELLIGRSASGVFKGNSSLEVLESVLAMTATKPPETLCGLHAMLLNASQASCSKGASATTSISLVSLALMMLTIDPEQRPSVESLLGWISWISGIPPVTLHPPASPLAPVRHICNSALPSNVKDLVRQLQKEIDAFANDGLAPRQPAPRRCGGRRPSQRNDLR